MMATLWQDVRYGLRMLRRSPGFVAVVLLVVGLGIGANTALFNAWDEVYMRPLPVRKPHELVSVQFWYRHGAWEFGGDQFSYPTYRAYRDSSQVFADLIAFTDAGGMDLRVGAETTRIQGVGVSRDYFPSLGLRPALGRLLTPEPQRSDDTADPVAVISHRLWRRRFGGQATVIGKQLVLDDQAVTVIGVAPAGFAGTTVGQVADVYLPLAICPGVENLHAPGNGCVHLLGRLKPGVERERAQAALRVLDAQRNPPKPGEPEITALVLEGSQGLVPREAQVTSYPLAAFMGIGGLVLAIACANVATLQLARAVNRQKEVAVRQALGAGRRRVVRQLLVENLLLASAAGAFGVLLAVGLDRVVCALLPRLTAPNMPPELQIHLVPGLHLRTLLFAAAIALLTGIASGLTPALGIMRRDVASALKESAGSVRLPTRGWNPHNALVVAQISLAVVVTVCSGLCLRNLIGLRRIDPGYDTAHLIVVHRDREGPPVFRPDDRSFMEGLRERVDGLPQVVSTSLSSNGPLNEGGWARGVDWIESPETPPSGEQGSWSLGIVSPEHFRTLGQTLLTGRGFTVHDGPDAPKVMIVNEVMAKQYWPNQDPRGKHVLFHGEQQAREIVGVVKTVKFRSLIEGTRAVAYVPFAQEPRCTPYLLIHTAGNPRPLFEAIRQVAADLGVPTGCSVRTVADQVSELLLPQRILTGVLNSFALVGLLLSAMGLYAVMAYAVRQRTREIGIRMALGAREYDVVTAVLSRGMWLVILGLALGTGLSLASSRLVVSLLPQIRAWDHYSLQGICLWDPVTYAGTMLALVAVALTACYLPARRAARIDPLVALRHE